MNFNAKWRGGFKPLRLKQGGWIPFIYFVVSLVLSIVLSPKPQKPRAAALEDFDVPVAEEDRPIPVLFGTKRITGANVLWYGDLGTRAIKKHSMFSSQTVGYKYMLGLHLGICHGPVDAFIALDVGDKRAWSGSITASGSVYIDKEELFGGEEREGGFLGLLEIAMGEPDQEPNAYLQSKISPAHLVGFTVVPGDPIPAFRGILGLIWHSYSLGNPLYRSKGGGYIGNTQYVKPWAVTARRILKGWQGDAPWYSAKAAIGDAMNPAHIVYQCLTDQEWGMASPTGLIDDANFRSVADTLFDEGMGLNLLWNQATTIDNFVGIVMDHIAGMLVFDHGTGKYQIQLIRGDYDPAALELFGVGNIIDVSRFERRSWGETINDLTITYTDPVTFKATALTVQDLGNIRAQGGTRISEKIDMSGFSDPELMNFIAGRELAARSTPLARIDLKVNRRLWAYGPGKVLKVTWPRYELDQMVFRVLNLKGGTLENGAMTVSLIEDIYALPGIEYSGIQDAPDAVLPPAVPPPTPDKAGTVVSTQLNTPPDTGLEDGDRYVVSAVATGDWTGHEGQIAVWDEDLDGWVFVDVPGGSLVYVEDQAGYAVVNHYGEAISPPWTPAIALLNEVGDIDPNDDYIVVYRGATNTNEYVKVPFGDVGGGGGSSGEFHTLSIASNAISLDLSLAGIFTVTLTTNVTSVTVANLVSGESNFFTLRVLQDSVGGHGFTTPAAWKFPAGTPYLPSSGINSIDLLQGITYDNGTTWLVSYQKGYG